MIYHIYSSYPVSDPDTLRRVSLAQQTWKSQPWQDVPVRDSDLPRLWHEKGRTWTYVRDVFDYGAAQAQSDDDIICYTNADIHVRQDCCAAVASCLQQSDACYAFRRDFGRLDAPVRFEDYCKGHNYAGSDLAAFRKRWWNRMRNEMPDGILGGEAWDPCFRILVERSNLGRVVAVLDVICHERHGGEFHWENPKNRYVLNMQHHCLRVACQFFRKHGISPESHGIPGWYVREHKL